MYMYMKALFSKRASEFSSRIFLHEIGSSGLKLQGPNPGSVLRSKSTRHERRCEAPSKWLLSINYAAFKLFIDINFYLDIVMKSWLIFRNTFVSWILKIPLARFENKPFISGTTIHLIYISEFFCENTPQVSNGYLACTHTNFVYTCRAQCDEGFVLTSDMSLNHTCGSRGWMPNFPQDFGQIACLSKSTIYRNLPSNRPLVKAIVYPAA